MATDFPCSNDKKGNEESKRERELIAYTIHQSELAVFMVII